MIITRAEIDTIVEYSSDKVFTEELDSMDDNDWGKIVNLKRIKVRCNSEYLGELAEIRTYSIVKNILAKSPNINNIHFLSDDTQTIILWNSHIFSKKIVSVSFKSRFCGSPLHITDHGNRG